MSILTRHLEVGDPIVLTYLAASHYNLACQRGEVTYANERAFGFPIRATVKHPTAGEIVVGLYPDNLMHHYNLTTDTGRT